MSRSLTRSQSLLLGVVVLAGVAMAGWAVVQMGQRQGLWTEKLEVVARFSQVPGLDRGTPVTVRGVKAGQVSGIDLPDSSDPDGKVILRLRLDRRFQALLPADSRVRVVSDGMLGSRTLNIEPGKDRTRTVSDGEEITVAETPNLSDIMQEASKTLQEIRDSNGTLAKLIKSDEAHKEVIGLVRETQDLVKKGQETFQQGQDVLKEGKEAIAAVKQDAEAIKRLPIIRGYVEDAHGLIYRPDQNVERRVYNTADLFELGQAQLTDNGRDHLDNLVPWFQAGKVKGSEIVVVTYADPTSTELPAPAAQSLTLKQSEAVVNYLKHLKAHRLNVLTSRKVTPLGMGQSPPPLPEKEPLPPNRTEILVFSPR